MKCRQSRRLFGAYWDDELTQAEREWLEGHFTSCASCRREYEELARALELAGSMPRVEVSSGFVEAVLAKARRRAPALDRVPTSRSRWIPITAIAALTAVLGGAALQWLGVPGMLRRTAPVAAVEPLVLEPVRIGAERAAGEIGLMADAEPLAGAAEIPDSLFDPSEDIEFILDAVTLRKGRAHTVTPPGSQPTRGAQAVITF
jgi:anti-sigma factor RsiW